MKSFLKCVAAWVLASAAAVGQAQSYPNKPIRIIVPYAAGQGTDIAARYIGNELSKAVNQPILIENRPGAGGNIGTQHAAKATADGYTLIIGTNATHAANSFLYTNPGYDPQADFEPIAMIGILPLVYVTRPNSPINSIQDLVQAARAKPNALNVAVSTTTCRMAHELFKQRADAPMFPVDFKGSAQAITDLAGGHIDYMVDTITSLSAYIKGGQFKALGVTSSSSSRLLPGVKSIAEQGVAGYELVGWTVLFAPKGVPSEVSRTLIAAMSKTLERADVQEKLLQIGIEPMTKSSAELKSFMVSEKDKWGKLIAASGLKPN